MWIIMYFHRASEFYELHDEADITEVYYYLSRWFDVVDKILGIQRFVDYLPVE